LWRFIHFSKGDKAKPDDVTQVQISRFHGATLSGGPRASPPPPANSSIASIRLFFTGERWRKQAFP